MISFQGSWGDDTNRLWGNKMAIDPNNENIVYVSNSTGVIFATYNGGTTWHIITDLYAAMSFATVSGRCYGKPQQSYGYCYIQCCDYRRTSTFTKPPAAIHSVYAYNRDAPNSLAPMDLTTIISLVRVQQHFRSSLSSHELWRKPSEWPAI